MSPSPALPRPPSDSEVCSLVNALAQAIDRHTRQVADRFGLTPAQAVALRELPEPRTLRELAQRMHCEASNATFVADRLEAMDLLERRPHPTDRRAKLLHLTPEGAKLRKDVVRQLGVDSPIGRLTRNEQDTLRELLARATD
ncbi:MULTISPECIES: MarR family winged helix-turn-helix transcriptional regulator [Streptomyces]|uniref:MarR family transcriptional regulator n=1 Tax=Streptomyces cinereoruber TaxID=67260 RepID=A0AAV4KFB0_9ACTN|nr:MULTISPECIES: MarR family transcriptional regulator [Streptomyces]AVH94577.1 MarR family transcriptional regulator [Streptomyces sp. WAC00288]KYG53306.1 MarR family transcriptional regulator [Streptomyces sp. WAC04657]MBB4157786.1 DNA-binding MarR family transcriptional regulator [Streptomyces cinereoruber]MBY8816299.1 MarR family transcriptional regulator [Streptomyces cinereoruber]NIH62061.1 DNA-binding MarR family transcriptional regulator [Streptomyces cinereoruber]